MYWTPTQNSPRRPLARRYRHARRVGAPSFRIPFGAAILPAALAVYLGVGAGLGALPAAAQVAEPQKSVSDERVDFVRDVQPIFREHCHGCHGADEQESGLRLDIRSQAFQGGYGYGKVLVEGNLEESLLLKMVAGHDDFPRMPPDDPLPAATVETLRQWVAQGAVWPEGVDDATLEDRSDHWAFQPLAESRDIKPADVGTTDPGRAHASSAPIDHFVRMKLESVGLREAPPADRITWLRRVTLDLTGLPPTPEQIDSFLEDREPQAFARVVDRLLASPHYGQRWAQHWLDVVRYADTHGFEVNTPRANAWPYRDYVIESFNRDTPFNQFVREQLAGDQLGEDRATGFLVTAAALLPGQIGKDEPSKRLARQDELAEIIINTSEALLGLSIGCARCHHHKSDAITHRDYYAMQAFFSGVQFGERSIHSPENDRRNAARQAAREKIEAIEQQLTSPNSSTQSGANEIAFRCRTAKFVRFQIHHANRHPDLGLIEPCLDEFEILTSGAKPRNVALASHGTRVSASGSRTSARHRLEFIHDGRYGNDHSWMSDEPGRGWVLFELPEAVEIDRVIWSRDRDGKFQDRTPTLFTVEVGRTADELQVVAGLTPTQQDRVTRLLEKREQLQAKLATLKPPQNIFGGRFEEPSPTHLLLRGDPEQPATEVAPAVPEVFQSLETAAGIPVSLPSDSSDSARRLALADWIARPDHPLTARVMVNRIWQGHFGTGLVATPSDFGRGGARPTHPQLLDWLATEFIRSGWSVKHLHRLIVLSRPYRQSARIDPDAQRIDAGTRWLWRYPARRLEAEAIRDSMLAVAGNLNPAMGGPGFDLFTSRGGLNGFPPIESFGEDGWRRMIYAHRIRMERDAVFGAFDCPDAGQTAARRMRSTTPIQALNLFNSQFTIDQSKILADRVRRESGEAQGDPVDYLFRLTLGRKPSPEERTEIQPLVDEHGLELLARVIFNSNEFLFLP